jgi:hypothetical protein
MFYVLYLFVTYLLTLPRIYCKEDEMERHVARTGEKRNAYRDLVGNPEETPLGRQRHMREDRNKLDIREIA